VIGEEVAAPRVLLRVGLGIFTSLHRAREAVK
jgi:hypothetical protein